MSFITGKPFVNELLGSLSADSLKSLQTLIDTTNPTPNGSYRLYDVGSSEGTSLADILNATKEYRFVSLSYDAIMKGFYTGILIKLSDTEYGFISWRPDSKDMRTVELKTNGSFDVLPQDLTTEEFRRVLGDALVSKGESVKVQVEDIEAPKVANKVIYTDGNGGAQWSEITGFQPELTPDSVPTDNDITTVIGFNGQGALRKAKTPSDSLMQNFAPAYDATATYAVGDICTHNGVMYECNTAIETAEAWNSEHWTETNVSSLIIGAINAGY